MVTRMHSSVWCWLILQVTTNYFYQLFKCLPVAKLIALLLPAVWSTLSLWTSQFPFYTLWLYNLCRYKQKTINLSRRSLLIIWNCTMLGKRMWLCNQRALVGGLWREEMWLPGRWYQLFYKCLDLMMLCNILRRVNWGREWIEEEGGNEEGGNKKDGLRGRVEMKRGEVTSLILDGECFGIFFIRFRGTKWSNIDRQFLHLP